MPSEPTSKHDSQRPVRILIVDDSPQNLIALEGLFHGRGHELVLAGSGRQALSLMGDDEFAVILLDVQMPEMDGFETAKIIRQRETSKTTPIIFLTAIDRSDSYEMKGYISGAVDFLFKPINGDILLAKISVFAELYHAKKEIQRQALLLNEQVLKDQELEAAKRALQVRDDFISIASHELNTPITPLSLQMQSFLRMLRKGSLKDAEPERLERMLMTANGQVERLSRLIKELVDVSRISSEDFPLNLEEVQLVEVVETVLRAFAEETFRVGCEIKLETMADPIGPWDRMRIEQVVVNLVANALKYGLGKPIVIRVSADGETAVLTLKDQGIGIAPVDQERIFHRFERAVSAKNYGGLGLGLYISRNIVELHGGSISVHSLPGEGATFTVTLPLRAD